MKNRDVVRISYIGRLESGEIFDLTDAELAKKEKIFNPSVKYSPVPVIVGARMIVPGLDEYLEKMDIGEKKTVSVKPENAFGNRDPKLIRVMPASAFKEAPQPGMIVDFGNIRGRVQSVSAGRVRVDFNHPLAGKTLIYEVKIEEKIEGIREKISSLMEFFNINAIVSVEGEKAEITAKIPQTLKDRISKLILENIPEIKEINFVDTYKKEEKEDKSPEQ